MKKVTLICRILFGIPLIFFGSFGLIAVWPDPEKFFSENEGMGPEATRVLLQLWNSGFLMLSIIGAHIVTGACVLFNRFVPLALLIHLPVTLQMLLFHLVLDPATGGIAYIVILLHGALLIIYKNHYKGILVFKTQAEAP